MKTKRRMKPATLPFAFWDTSAILPLCTHQRQSDPARQMTRHFRPVVWWGTRIEAVSGIRRLLRENLLTIDQSAMAMTRLDQLQSRWDEIIPTEAVRETAELLLGRHKLRAGDALQLAAALEWCGHHPRGKIIVGADNDLLRAAAAEGFTCRLL